jgi:hypothetical protein
MFWSSADPCYLLLSSCKQIAREVSMMMRFQHPHLVRAYHYVTWSSAAAADAGDLPEVRPRLTTVDHM